MTMGDGLPCRKCGTSDWYKTGHCKCCAREKGRQYNARNQEAVKERGRLYRKNNPDRIKESQRKYQESNLPKIRARQRKWQDEHPEVKPVYRQRSYERYKNRELESHRRYRHNNPVKFVVYANNRRTRKTAAGGSYTEQEWKELCKQYDNRCLRCGRDDRPLTADHVLPVSKGGSSDISNIQPLCKPCNSWKKDRHKDFRTKPGLMRWIQKKLFG